MSESTFPISIAPPGAALSSRSSEGVQLRWVIVLWTSFFVALGALCLKIATFSAILYSAATVALFMLPGLLIAPVFWGDQRRHRLERVIVGGVFGMAVSGYAAVVTGFLGGWSPKRITLSIFGLSLICWVIARLFRGRIAVPSRDWTRLDSALLAAIGIVLVLFTALPALHVGKLTSRGYAYTWLYGIDFLARSDFAVAMTSRLPPDLFWMTGVPLRMYLVGYAPPAFAFAASGRAVDLHSVVLLTTLAFAFFLLGSLFLFLRAIISEARVLIPTLFISLVASSYYWVYDFAKAPFIRPGHRFDFHDSVSHLFQRTCLVEPQAALSSSLLLIVLAFLVPARYRLKSFPLAAFLGFCLGLSFGADAMQGVVVIAWFGLLYSLRFIFIKGSLRDELAPFLTTVAVTGLICGSYFWLGMYQRSSSHLIEFNFNIWMLKYGLVFFPVEFGPLVLLGVWGAVKWWRQSRDAFAWPFLLLAFVAMLPVMFLKQTTVPRPRMADRLLPIALIVFAAFLIRELWSGRSSRRARVWAALLVLAAVPTFFTDIYFTSNVDDLYNTRYVLPQDMQACDWIRGNLPPTAIVQGTYNYFIPPDRGLYVSLIASFAQRPQVLGWFSGAATLVDDGWQLARQRRAEIEATLGSGNLDSLIAFLDKYLVDYVYVGPVEQRLYKPLLPLLQSAPAEFQPVYSKDGVFIFRYLGRVHPGHPAPPLS